jgi:UDP-glucose 4-epimerase
VARANVAALKSTHDGVLNIGTGTSVSLLQLIDALALCAGKTPQVRFDAPAAGDIRDSAMCPDRMRAVLGFVPATPLVAGLKQLLAAGA